LRLSKAQREEVSQHQRLKKRNAHFEKLIEVVMDENGKFQRNDNNDEICLPEGAAFDD
jgi:hypothetical protein